MIKYYKFHSSSGLDIEIPFYHDSEHPFPYWEELYPDGMAFSFLIEKGQGIEFSSYLRKLRNERDVVHVKKYFLNKNGTIRS